MQTLPTTLPKSVIIEKTALSQLRVRTTEKLYANNPNPTTLREYKASAKVRDAWQKLFHETI